MACCSFVLNTEAVSWMKEDEVKKVPFSNLNKDNKSAKPTAPAPKANWESSSSSGRIWSVYSQFQ